jgi:competence protein ComEA
MKTPIVLAAGAVVVAVVAALYRAPHDAGLPSSSQAPGLAVEGTLQSDRALRPASRATSPAHVVVYVAGEVSRSGVYALPVGSRVDAALRAAGGTSPHADLLAINLAEPLADGARVLVPQRGAVTDYAAFDAGSHAARTRAGSHSHRGGKHGRRHHKVPPAAPIDLNAADATQLQAIPGVGPSLAERIVAFRETNGPFHSTDELLDVAGMTDRRLDAISPYVVVP